MIFKEIFGFWRIHYVHSHSTRNYLKAPPHIYIQYLVRKQNMVKSLSIRQKKVLALHLNTMIILKKIKRRKQTPRKWWVHPIWKERNEQGDYKTLVSSICTCHPIMFMKTTIKNMKFNHTHNLFKRFKHFEGRTKHSTEGICEWIQRNLIE